MKIRALLAVAAVTAGAAGCAPRDPCADTPLNRDRALFATESAVKERLRAPASARFPTNHVGQGAGVILLGECRFHVRSWVDSQNGFGAMLRSTYTAEVVPTSDGRYQIESLRISER